MHNFPPKITSAKPGAHKCEEASVGRDASMKLNFSCSVSSATDAVACARAFEPEARSVLYPRVCVCSGRVLSRNI